jgi:hypothetical protein
MCKVFYALPVVRVRICLQARHAHLQTVPLVWSAATVTDFSGLSSLP